MQAYQSTPDYYREYIEHGWLKDQVAKAHKYIERWKGKNGKWYYRYKSKVQEKVTKARRKAAGINDASEISKNGKPYTNYRGFRYDSGNANSRSRVNPSTNGNTKWYDGYHNKIVKTTKIKLPKNKNLRDRGYSHSQGSGEPKRLRNLATRNSIYKKITSNAPTGKDTMTLQDYQAIMERLNSRKRSGKTTYKKK